jgi:uncharacterized protein (TIRG00374 family)
VGIAVVVTVGVAAAVIVTLATGGRDTLAGVLRLPLPVLAAIAGLNVLSWFGEAVVFASLAGRRRPRDLARMVAVYVGGGFPALVTPFGSGGIPGWTWALSQEGLSAGEAAAAVGARALVTGVFFSAAGVVAAVMLPARAAGAAGGAWWGIGALALALAALALLVSRPERAGAVVARLAGSRVVVRLVGARRAEYASASAERETERFAGTLRSLVRERPGSLALAMLGLLVSRACLLAILPVTLMGLGWRGEVLPVLATVVGVWVLASASPTPGGSGAVETALTVALSTFAPLAVAGAAALLWRGVTFYMDLIAGWVLFTRYLAGARRTGS